MKPLLCALVLAAAPAALAAPAGAQRAADATQQAKAHFRKGTDLYKQARYREAIAEFEAAYKLRPHGVIHFNLAQCHERLGDIPAALQAYHEYLRAVPDAEDRNTVHAAMANLEARLGAAGVQQLLVYTDPAGAEVLVDGQSKGRAPLAVVLPHGSHTVTLVKAGYRTTTRQAVLSPQASVEIDVALQKLDLTAPPPAAPSGAAPTAATPPSATPTLTATPAAAPTATGTAPTGRPGTVPASATAPAPAPAPPAPRPRLWTWVAAGAAAAALAGGAVYGLSARSAENDLKGSVHDGPTAQRLADQARSRSRNANVLYGVGAAAGAGAVTLFFVEGRF